MFLLAQLGLFLMLFTRFWQRGVETSLALQNPMPNLSLPPILPIAGVVDSVDLLHPHHRIQLTSEPSITPAVNDPISNPEPAPPSLDEPDPGVFHHDPTRPPQ
jgi:hypothetical protein